MKTDAGTWVRLGLFVVLLAVGGAILAFAVLLARLVPVVPFTAVNYGSGLTAVTFPAYLLATAVGIIPGTLAYVAVGAYGTDPGNWPFLLAAGVLVALSLGGAWLARRRSSPDGAHAERPDPKE